MHAQSELIVRIVCFLNRQTLLPAKRLKSQSQRYRRESVKSVKLLQFINETIVWPTINLQTKGK